MSTAAQTRANNKYKKNHYKRLICEVRKEFYDDNIQPFTAERNISVNALVRRSMDYVIKNGVDLSKEI